MGYISPALAVRDMKKTIEFYRDSLGFNMVLVSPDINNPAYAELSKDGMALMFILAKNCAIGSEEKLGVGVNLYMQIDGDIDEYYQELKKRGVKITVDITDEPYGIRDFTVEDVNGYQLTFNQVSKTSASPDTTVTKPENLGWETQPLYTTSTVSSEKGASKAKTKRSSTE